MHERPNLYSPVPLTTQSDILKTYYDLFEVRGGQCAGKYIHLKVYNSFAVTEGLIWEVKNGEGNIVEVVTPVSKLSPTQKDHWEQFVRSKKFAEDSGILVAQGLGDIHFPITSPYSPHGSINLAVDLEQARREVVKNVLSDLTDDQAQAALGSRYTAKIVNSLATPSWFEEVKI